MDECPICFDSLGNWDCDIKLSCGHLFHTHCIRKWLDTTPNCPVCRVKYLTPLVSIHDYTNHDIPSKFISRILRKEQINTDKLVLTHQKDNLVIHNYYTGEAIYSEPYPL